jgi:F-type H+-transporting ATPase subunit a
MSNTLIFINSPLEQFEVTNLIGLNAPIFGYLNIALTNLSLYSFLTISLIIALHYYANNNTKLLPSK